MKYMGSKSRIAKDIVPIIQSYIDENEITEYYEPFVGGANIIDKIRCKNKYGSDLNPYLISLLNHVKNGGELYPSVSRELYNEAKADFIAGSKDRFEDWQIGNIGFLASFNGKFFDGGYAKPGYVKTKTGLRYRDYYQECLNNISAQAPKLAGINLKCSDYSDITPPTKAVIYCDPPYACTTKYANSDGFDYEKFWNKMRELSKDNIVIVSEQQAPDDWKCIWSKAMNRIINAKKQKQRINRKTICH